MRFRPLAVFAATVSIVILAGAFGSSAQAAADQARRDRPMDCAKAADTARCESLNQKIVACRHKTDDAWRDCMYGSNRAASFTPPLPRDCDKARNRAACEAHASALLACVDKRTRAEHRGCMDAQRRESAR